MSCKLCWTSRDCCSLLRMLSDTKFCLVWLVDWVKAMMKKTCSCCQHGSEVSELQFLPSTPIQLFIKDLRSSCITYPSKDNHHPEATRAEQRQAKATLYTVNRTTAGERIFLCKGIQLSCVLQLQDIVCNLLPPTRAWKKKANSATVAFRRLARVLSKKLAQP